MTISLVRFNPFMSSGVFFLFLYACLCTMEGPLRKHAYSNILKILLPKNEDSQKKILIFFIFLLET